MVAAKIGQRRMRYGSYSYWWRAVDQVFVRINAETHYPYLRRACDHKGEGLEIAAKKRGDGEAALGLSRKAIKKYANSKRIATDELPSDGAAMKQLSADPRQTSAKWLNNRAENSHQPLRRREQAMAGFTDIRTLQESASLLASVHNHFNRQRISTAFPFSHPGFQVAWSPMAAGYNYDAKLRIASAGLSPASTAARADSFHLGSYPHALKKLFAS